MPITWQLGFLQFDESESETGEAKPHHNYLEGSRRTVPKKETRAEVVWRKTPF